MGDRIKREGLLPGALRPATAKEVNKLKKYLVRVAYTVSSLAALLAVLGAGRKFPK
jgi:hypothetical protein